MDVSALASAFKNGWLMQLQSLDLSFRVGISTVSLVQLVEAWKQGMIRKRLKNEEEMVTEKGQKVEDPQEGEGDHLALKTLKLRCLVLGHIYRRVMNV